MRATYWTLVPLSAVFLSAAALADSPPPLEFVDGAFPASSWSQILPVPSTPSGGTAKATAVNSGGHPGSYVEITMKTTAVVGPGRSAVAFIYINTKATYNPRFCPIGSIDYSEDEFSDSHNTANPFVGPALRQGGKIYVKSGASKQLNSWTTTSFTGIQRGEFVELDTTGSTWLNPASHPDFSSLGSTIEFGFWQYIDVPNVPPPPSGYLCLPPDSDFCRPSLPAVASTMGIDNWRLRLNFSAVRPTKETQPNAGTVSDSISTATGEYYEETAEINLGGPLPLRFGRYYASNLLASGVSSALGNNWMHNFDVALALSATDAVVRLYRGKQVRFSQTSTGYVPAAQEEYPYQLISSGSSTLQFLDPETNWIYTFASNGSLTRLQDRNGNTLTITRGSASPGPDQVSDGLGRRLSFVYSGGRLVRVEDQGGRSVSFAYDGKNLAAVSDANGGVTRYSYTTAGGVNGAIGLINSKSLPDGKLLFTQAYDEQGRVVKRTTASGSSIFLRFDAPVDSVTTIVEPLGTSIQHKYQSSGNLIAYVDETGQAVRLSYDSVNRPVSLTDRLGDVTTMVYDSQSGRVASSKDALGNTTKYSYEAQSQAGFTFYNLTRIEYPDGSSAGYTYSSTGNRLTVTNQNGGVTVYAYNALGQVTSEINPMGGLTAWAYNSDGTVATVTRPANSTTRFSYDIWGRLEKSTNPDGTTVTYAYDHRDNPISITDGRAKTRTWTYDDNDLLQSASSANGSRATIRYDSELRPVSITSFGGGTTTVVLDAGGRAQSLTLPTGEEIGFGFDSLNRLTTANDCSGKGISFRYDKEGVPAAAWDAAGAVWLFTTDKAGRFVGITSPLGRTFGLTYDKAGRQVSVTDPLGQATSYARDATGAIKALTLPGGISEAYTRNDLGQITTVVDANANAWRRTFDNQGRRTSATDPLGRIASYKYDSQNRLTTIAFPQGSVAYTYDAAGNATRQVYSDGVDLKFTFNDTNQVVSANGISLSYNAHGDVIYSNGIEVLRDSSNRITAISYAPGRSVWYSYDCRGLLTQVKDWLGGVTEFAYDEVRRLASIRRPNGVTTTYSYDRDSRLVGVREEGDELLASIDLLLDGAGRVISADRNLPLEPNLAGGINEFGYDAAGQAKGATYDSLGRPVELGLHTFGWDLASRLLSYAGPDGSAAFTYDAYGMRISRTGGDGTTTNYVLNYAFPAPVVSIVRDGAQNDVRYYVWLPNGELLYSIEASDSNRRFFHFDETGSTLFLTDDAGAVTDAYGISPYGEQVEHSGASENTFTFLGKYGVMQEDSTGLFYAGSRYYDSTMARFLCPESAAGSVESELDIYQYAFSHPLYSVDALGRSKDRKGVSTREGELGKFILGLANIESGLPESGEPLFSRETSGLLYPSELSRNDTFSWPQSIAPRLPMPLPATAAVSTYCTYAANAMSGRCINSKRENKPMRSGSSVP